MSEYPAQHEIDSPEQAGSYMHPSEESEFDRDIFGKRPKGRADWSHRRGEPRVFALFWMIYLMCATVIMFSSMSKAHAIGPEITRPAARTMLMIVMLGLCVLWPMVRLSQQHPSGSFVRFLLRDALVLFLPLQAVLWPHVAPILAHWPIPVVGHLVLLCAAWVLLLSGMQALALGSINRNGAGALPRVIWMLVTLLIVFAAPIYAIIAAPSVPVPIDQPRVGWLMSPITGVLEIVRDRAELGMSTRVFPQQTRMLIAIGCVGLALLLIARALEVARARVRA